MSTLTEFLLARIAEDETCQACQHPVIYHHARWCRVPTGAVNAEGQRLICCCEASDSHDRVLREGEAKRAVIAAALRAAEAVDDEGCGHTASQIGSETDACRHVPPPPGYVVPGPPHPETYDTHPIYSGCHGVPVAHDILRPLAAVYRDHPDYRDEWRP